MLPRIFFVLAAHAFWIWRMGPFGQKHVLRARNAVVLLLVGQSDSGKAELMHGVPAGPKNAAFNGIAERVITTVYGHLGDDIDNVRLNLQHLNLTQEPIVGSEGVFPPSAGVGEGRSASNGSNGCVSYWGPHVLFLGRICR